MAPEVILAMDEGQYDGKVVETFCNCLNPKINLIKFSFVAPTHFL